MKQYYRATAHGGEWGVGETPEAALEQAREVIGDPNAQFEIETISKAVYDRTVENDRTGWVGCPVIITDDDFLKAASTPFDSRPSREVSRIALTVTERRDRFRQLRETVGLSVPQLAKALGRPLGTITKYTHGGRSSIVPPQKVIDAMEDLAFAQTLDQINRAKRIATERGFAIMIDDEVDQLAHPWLSDVAPEHLVLSRQKAAAFKRGETVIVDDRSAR